MSTSSAMRLATILALVSLAVSFVTAEALLRNSALAGRRVLQDTPTDGSDDTASGDASSDRDAIAQDAKSAKSRAAAAVDAHEKKLAAARNGTKTNIFNLGRAISALTAALATNVQVKAAAFRATALADEALDLLQKAPEAERLAATAQENLARAEAKAANAVGVAKFLAQAALTVARGIANAAKIASDRIIPNARQKASDALVAAGQAETLANK